MPRKLYSKEENKKKKIEHVSLINKSMFPSLSKPINCLRSHILFLNGRKASKCAATRKKYSLISAIYTILPDFSFECFKDGLTSVFDSFNYLKRFYRSQMDHSLWRAIEFSGFYSFGRSRMTRQHHSNCDGGQNAKQ